MKNRAIKLSRDKELKGIKKKAVYYSLVFPDKYPFKVKQLLAQLKYSITTLHKYKPDDVDIFLFIEQTRMNLWEENEKNDKHNVCAGITKTLKEISKFVEIVPFNISDKFWWDGTPKYSEISNLRRKGAQSRTRQRNRHHPTKYNLGISMLLDPTDPITDTIPTRSPVALDNLSAVYHDLSSKNVPYNDKMELALKMHANEMTLQGPTKDYWKMAIHKWFHLPSLFEERNYDSVMFLDGDTICYKEFDYLFYKYYDSENIACKKESSAHEINNAFIKTYSEVDFPMNSGQFIISKQLYTNKLSKMKDNDFGTLFDCALLAHQLGKNPHRKDGTWPEKIYWIAEQNGAALCLARQGVHFTEMNPHDFALFSQMNDIATGEFPNKIPNTTIYHYGTTQTVSHLPVEYWLWAGKEGDADALIQYPEEMWNKLKNIWCPCGGLKQRERIRKITGKVNLKQLEKYYTKIGYDIGEINRVMGTWKNFVTMKENDMEGIVPVPHQKVKKKKRIHLAENYTAKGWDKQELGIGFML